MSLFSTTNEYNHHYAKILSAFFHFKTSCHESTNLMYLISKAKHTNKVFFVNTELIILSAIHFPESPKGYRKR